MKIKRPIREVLPVANDLLAKLEPFCDKIELAGSIRRKKPLVGDIEIICILKKIPKTAQLSLFELMKSEKKTMPGLMDYLRNYEIIRGNLDHGKMISFKTESGIQVDVFTGNETNYGLIKTYRTGPAKYNENFMIPKLKSRGYFPRGGFIYKGDLMVPVPSEETLYELMGIEFHPPEERERFC